MSRRHIMHSAKFRFQKPNPSKFWLERQNFNYTSPTLLFSLLELFLAQLISCAVNKVLLDSRLVFSLWDALIYVSLQLFMSLTWTNFREYISLDDSLDKTNLFSCCKSPWYNFCAFFPVKNGAVAPLFCVRVSKCRVWGTSLCRRSIVVKNIWVFPKCFHI